MFRAVNKHTHTHILMVATGFFVNYRNNRANNVQQAERCERGMRAAGERERVDHFRHCQHLRPSQATHKCDLSATDRWSSGRNRRVTVTAIGRRETGDGETGVAAVKLPVASCNCKAEHWKLFAVLWCFQTRGNKEEKQANAITTISILDSHDPKFGVNLKMSSHKMGPNGGKNSALRQPSGAAAGAYLVHNLQLYASDKSKWTRRKAMLEPKPKPKPKLNPSTSRTAAKADAAGERSRWFMMAFHKSLQPKLTV